MAINGGQLNLELLRDLIEATNCFSQGRLMACSEMKINDIFNNIKLTETIASLVVMHRNQIAERCQTGKQRCVQIKNCFRDNNPSGLDYCLKRDPLRTSGGQCVCT